jgi:hypothetical protein
MWGDSSAAGFHRVRVGDGTPWTLVGPDFSQAFTLTGTVPEPSTFVLSALGLAAIARRPR